MCHLKNGFQKLPNHQVSIPYYVFFRNNWSIFNNMRCKFFWFFKFILHFQTRRQSDGVPGAVGGILPCQCCCCTVAPRAVILPPAGIVTRFVRDQQQQRRDSAGRHCTADHAPTSAGTAYGKLDCGIAYCLNSTYAKMWWNVWI